MVVLAVVLAAVLAVVLLIVLLVCCDCACPAKVSEDWSVKLADFGEVLRPALYFVCRSTRGWPVLSVSLARWHISISPASVSLARWQARLCAAQGLPMSLVGSPGYMAPEIMRGKHGQAPSAHSSAPLCPPSACMLDC